MKLQPVAQVPEVKDVWALLSFLTDPEAVAERLKSLEAYRDEINSLIEAYGKAKEIETLHEQAKALAAHAESELQEARAKASKIVSDAQTTADADRAALKAAIGAAEAERAKAAAEKAALQKREAELDRALRECDKKLGEAEILAGKAEQRMRAAEKIRAEYEDKKAKLLAAAQ